MAPLANILGALMWPTLAVTVFRNLDDPDPWPAPDVASAHIDGLPNTSPELAEVYSSNLDASAATREHIGGTNFPGSLESSTSELAGAALVKALSPNRIKNILRWLVEGYWERRAGWPDLIVLRWDDTNMPVPTSCEFIEVKSRQDRLSKGQIAWRAANDLRLHLPFRVIRVIGEDAKDAQHAAALPHTKPGPVWVPDVLLEHPFVLPFVGADRIRRSRSRW
ncbi:VRR-NUC domain-containing protein [Nocardioides sp. NPDC126508]